MKTDYPKYRIAAAIRPVFLHTVLFFKLLNRVVPVIGNGLQTGIAVIVSIYLMVVAGDNGRLPTEQWNHSLMMMALVLMLLQYPTLVKYMGNPEDKLESTDAFFFWMTFSYLLIGLIWVVAGHYAVIGLIAAWLMLTMPLLGVAGLLVGLYKWIERRRQPKDVTP